MCQRGTPARCSLERLSQDIETTGINGRGERLGRPPVPPIQIEKIKALRQEGLSYRKIAKRMDLSVCTVHRLAA